MLLVLFGLTVFAGAMSFMQFSLAPKEDHNIRRDVAHIKVIDPVVDAEMPVKTYNVSTNAILETHKYLLKKPEIQIPSSITKPEVKIQSPTIQDIEVAVFVLSRRSAFNTRQVIRNTWASRHKNVFFAVGKCCTIPPDDRKKYTCSRKKPSTVLAQKIWDSKCVAQDEKLATENDKYKDIITMPDVDVYRHLPQKVKYCYKWGLKHTSARWFVKTDDDSVVRIHTLGSFLKKTYDSTKPMVIGRIANGWSVPRSGKWAENNYKPSKYPKFPLGSVGHVVSKPVATYIADNSNKLFNYQGEDVSVGIWLHNSPLKINWVSSKRMTNHGNCKDTGMFVIGHNIEPEKMKACFAHRDELVTASQEMNIRNISPLSLDLENRFDIIVKAVYAAEWLKKGKVSDFTTNMYKKHLKVWNNFQEPCTFKGQKDWFDASKPCVEKTSAQDFIRSFQKTIQSLKENGFDNSKSIVPVTSNLFPLNGAHRIAAAIALRMHTMPVQITSSSHSFNWDANFFIKKGFDKKYADFASRNFAMYSNAVESELSFLKNHKHNLHAVVLFPSVKNQKVNTVKTILTKHAQIITERIFWLNKDAADMFVQQIYPNEAWVSNGAWGKTNYCFPKGTARFPIRVFFISTSLSLKKVLDTKKKIRELYSIGKHSIHITDTRSQAMDVAKMLLNKHSLRYINNTKWTSPLQRKKFKCRKPQNIDENARFYIDGRPCALDTACGGVPRIFTKSKAHWSSVEELWFALDTAKIKYALLRNFENGVIHPKDAHPDVDILLESLEPACCVMTMYGGPEAKCKRNVQNQGQHVTIGGKKVKLDIRILGDNYYGDKWSKDMLQRRDQGHIPNSIAWSISPKDYLFSLIYHVLVHKNKIPSDYPARICKKAKRLGYAMQIKQCSDRKYLENFVSTWMSSRGYQFIKPLDRNVPYNAPKVNPMQKTNKMTYASLLQDIKAECGELCDTTSKGSPGKFFDKITKNVDCGKLFNSPHLDLPQTLSDVPPTKIPNVMKDSFTYNGRVKVKPRYYNERSHKNKVQKKTGVWLETDVEQQIKQASQRNLKGTYGITTTNELIDAIEQMDVVNKHILVIGSRRPWVEACLLNAGAKHVTTLEYSKIVNHHPKLTTMTTEEMYSQWDRSGYKGTYFDGVVSFSSLEHSGLGRYGDELNPWGDVITMAKAWCVTKSGGHALVGVPYGKKDTIEWNAHRVYGPIMWPFLATNWNQIWKDSRGMHRIHLLQKPKEVVKTRPVFAGRILTENNQLRLRNPVLCSGKKSSEVWNLEKYNQALSKPKNPQKILIYKVPQRKLSGGFGSRLFGIANVFMWSLLTDRTFLIDWSRLGIAFESNIVHWDQKIPNKKPFVVSLVDKTLSKKQLQGDIESYWKGHDVVEIHGASMPSEPILRKNFNYDFDDFGFIPTCSQKWQGKFAENVRRMNTQFNMWKSVMWHSLFRPSKELLALTDPITKQFVNFKRVIGVHVRLGGRIGNANDVMRIGPKCGHSCLPADFDWKEWFTNCMQTKIQMGDVAFFITSDRPKNELDALFEVTKGVKVFYLPKNRIVHTDRTPDQSKTEWLETVADWLILSKTDEILMSPSSFSLTAAMYGGSVPTMLGEKCANQIKPSCSWPPPLYPNKHTTPEKHMKKLTKIQQWAENNKDSLVYLVSGGLLGMYRDGALISYDSDIDIRYNVPKKKKHNFMKFKSGKLSLNALEKWGDHWNGFWYIDPKDINDDFVSKFNKDLICKPSRSSPIQTHIHARLEIEYTYGPAWFIRMTLKSMTPNHFIEWVKPNARLNKDWVEMIKTINKIDADSNGDVTVAEITDYVQKDGIDTKQYNLQISPRDRCRASRMLNWFLQYNKSPYRIKNTDKSALNGNHRLFNFIECDNI